MKEEVISGWFGTKARTGCGHQKVNSRNDKRWGVEVSEIIQWLKCGRVSEIEGKKAMVTWNRWTKGTWTALRFTKTKYLGSDVENELEEFEIRAADYIRIHFLVRANGLY